MLAAPTLTGNRQAVEEGTMVSAQEEGTKGRVVVVTGAARGIGRAVTARCLAAGMKVVAVDQDEDALARLSQEVSADGNLSSLVGDVARQETAEAAVARALERFGRLDGIVSNAGTFQAAPLSETTLDQLYRFRLDRTCVRFGCASPSSDRCAQQTAAMAWLCGSINFSLAIGRLSRKVCIGVFP
jgi:NAD(P)-dependent dehydrogenase (short-subunit alcohol dehydrogenase family)